VSALLELEDLHVWFDLGDGRELHAVQGVSLSLDEGQRLGLVGESGCGKTTTVLGLLGLLESSATVSGRMLLNGTDILAGGEETIRPHRWTDLAIVFQGAMNALNPVQTVGAQIVEALEVHDRASGRMARARVAELLESVGIPRDRGERFPHEFSGGMRQRAAIAIALACDPSVLVADEPTTALDVMVQAQILELLVPLPRLRPRAAARHPRPAGGRSALRPGGGHVRGRDRGTRAGRRALPRAAPPVHAAALRGDAGPARERRAGLDPGGAAAPRPALAGLPVPTALRPRLLAVYHGAAGPACARR
jgi:ABC-type dipeptide/oligopeptide/nickel transport system ATPase subunit